VDDALLAALGGNPGGSGLVMPRHSLMAALHGAAGGLLERGGGVAAAAAEAAAAAAAAAQQQQRPERVVFEVRVYSIDGPSFGQVVRAKR
jgi:hypothetical protein